jgi:hypothetical protein
VGEGKTRLPEQCFLTILRIGPRSLGVDGDASPIADNLLTGDEHVSDRACPTSPHEVQRHIAAR